MRGLLANKNGLLLPHEVDPRGGTLLERSSSARSITNSALIRPKLSLPFVPYFAKARRRLHEAGKLLWQKAFTRPDEIRAKTTATAAATSRHWEEETEGSISSAIHWGRGG